MDGHRVAQATYRIPLTGRLTVLPGLTCEFATHAPNYDADLPRESGQQRSATASSAVCTCAGVCAYTLTSMNVAEIVERAKGSAGLSVRALAERANVAASTITRIHAGTLAPTFPLIER